METVSAAELAIKFPNIKDLIDRAIAVPDDMWFNMLKDINNKDYKYIATTLNKYRNKGNNNNVFVLQKLISLSTAIGIANKKITRGIMKHQEFLDLLSVPHHKTLIKIKYGKGATTSLSCYPHSANKPRIDKRESDEAIIAELLCEDKSKYKIELSTLFKVGLKAIDTFIRLNGSRTLDNYRKAFFGTDLNNENIGFWITLHIDSRSHRCCIPANSFVDMLSSAIESNTTSIYNYSVEYNKKIYNTPELAIHCPVCDIKAKYEMRDNATLHTINLNYIKLSFLLKQLGTDKYDEIMNKYKSIRNSLAIASNRHNVYYCKTEGCKYQHNPRIIVLSNSCTEYNFGKKVTIKSTCLDKYNKQGFGNFHKFRCSCAVEVCAICLKPEIEHLGETKVCPQKETLPPEEIQAMLEKGFKQCPCCKVFTEHTEGCDHMTCIVCRNHWCFRCCELLPVDPITGSRYVHRCTAPEIDGHYQAYVLPGEMPPGVGNMYIEYNPAEHHVCY
jgi:uncharacterized ubiquitin-like protein YukD